ncbi:MAG: hypothetical protein RLO81_10045 [Fulvivirga sp.]
MNSEENIDSDYSYLINLFEKEVKSRIEFMNQSNNDSISTTIEIDTSIVMDITNSNLYTVLTQFTSEDKRVKIGVLGIGNFDDKSPPFSVMIGRNVKQILGDSSIVAGDSLYFYGKLIDDYGTRPIKMAFDLKFDGTNYPWR